ncbi:MAG TPA: hypothetical protein VGG72_28205 [Bryobacteraceae bacterium]|jgi:hypothetical protein
MKKVLGIVALTMAGVCALVFAGDYLSVRLAIPKRDQFDYVDVRHFYAVKLKNRKTEYTYDQPQPMECVNSLLPHYGDTPCWYRKKHPVIQVNLDSGPFGAWIDTP